MNLKTKIKIKYALYYILGIVTLGIILLIAYFYNRLIETCITIVIFYIYRGLFDKQYHSHSIYLCSIISILVFTVVINLEVNISISILSSVVITFILTLLSYYIRDYLDQKVLINTYRTKLNNINVRCIENLTEEELISLMPGIRYGVLHIVYGYLHKPKELNANGYAYRNNISEATLYRYLKQVKTKYESLGLNS